MVLDRKKFIQDVTVNVSYVAIIAFAQEVGMDDYAHRLQHRDLLSVKGWNGSFEHAPFIKIR